MTRKFRMFTNGFVARLSTWSIQSTRFNGIDGVYVKTLVGPAYSAEPSSNGPGILQEKFIESTFYRSLNWNGIVYKSAIVFGVNRRVNTWGVSTRILEKVHVTASNMFSNSKSESRAW